MPAEYPSYAPWAKSTQTPDPGPRTPDTAHAPGTRHPTPDTFSTVPTPSPSLLVADDDPAVLEALRLLLKSEGMQVETATSPGGVLSAVETRDFDAALIDMNYTRDTTGGIERLDLISRIQTLDASLPVMVMTACGAIRMTQRLENENRTLRRDGTPELVATSPAMQPVLRLMERVAPSDANALVVGEHGTGKEVVARWLHAASARANRPLVTVNLGGLAEGVFESELFGHMRGAFTDAKTDRVGRFELADGGTLFLDEIANLTMSQQAKLLRVLQTGELERVGSSKTRHVDVRLISATNADLAAEVAAGRFREDLLFRINTIEIKLPPLRERRDDIPLLAAHFLAEYAARYRKPVSKIHPDAMRALLAYSWPGNVRELAHALERAVLLAEGDTLRPSDLNLRPPGEGASRLEDMSLEEVERVLIQKALTRFEGNVSAAAKALGLSRSALYRRLQRHSL